MVGIVQADQTDIATKARAPAARSLQTSDYQRLASFRMALRRFLHFSETVTAKVGLSGQQYQAMLVVRSCAGRAPVSINDLARQLLIRHNSAVGMVDRLATLGLLARARCAKDRRTVHLLLTGKGERVLGALAAVHRQKLRRLGPDIHRILGELAGAWNRRSLRSSVDR
jgi:DNA-binding MarR family transcriptional regulator